MNKILLVTCICLTIFACVTTISVVSLNNRAQKEDIARSTALKQIEYSNYSSSHLKELAEQGDELAKAQQQKRGNEIMEALYIQNRD